MRRAALAITLALSCSVDDAFLDRELFECTGPSDCGEGWGCVRASPYAVDFCAPDCNAQSCDGVCTEQDDRSLCLRGCRIDSDGSTSACPSDDFVCIRTSADRDDGVCYPVSPCDRTADCASGEVCLSELIGLTGDSTPSNLYCVPRPDDAGQCPPRSEPLRLSTGALCLATCAPPDTRCPPGFGCLLQAAVFAGNAEDVVCLPGVHGVPCDDDTNCVVGRCIDTGAPGKQCTLSCEEAARLAGGCDNLVNLSSFVNSLAFECDPDAGDGADGGLCVTRSSVGFICTTPESNAYVCEDGLECRSFGIDGGMLKLCTRDCFQDAQCNGPGDRLNYCQPSGFGAGTCVPRGGPGAECVESNQCLSGRCLRGACAEGA